MSHECERGDAIGVQDNEPIFPIIKGYTRPPGGWCENGSFRLLTILDRNGPVIECAIHTFSLDKPPVYTALSYTWGSAIPGDGLTSALDRILLCNGGSVPITASLCHALRSMPKDHYYIWADAVCINQRDVAERSAQVALMGKIYSSASQVVVWLGPADESTPTAFRFILDIARRLPSEVSLYNLGESNRPFSDPEFWSKIGRPEWTIAERHALARLFMRNWFSRTWVIQEVVLAGDAGCLVFCGSYSAPWWALTVVSAFAPQQVLTRVALAQVPGVREALVTAGGYIRVIGHVPQTIAYLKERYKKAIAGISTENRAYVAAKLLESIILTTRNMEASDPKDKVFAPVALLLHLLPSDQLTARLQPDYSKPVAQIFTEVRTFMMQNCKSARDRRSLMLSVFGEKPRSRVEGLPTWVPDYGDHTILTINAHVDRNFSCLTGLAPDSLYENKVTPRDGKLHIWASRFSTISVLLPPMFQTARGSLTELLTWLQSVAALPDFDTSGQPAILSMIHCLTTDGTREYDCKTAYGKFRDMFTSLFCLLTSRSEISVGELLAPASNLTRLLLELETRGISAFPTCDQLRAALEDPISAKKSEDDAFRSIKINGWQLFRSVSGHLGMVRTAARVGDEILFVAGHTVPFMFRKTDQNGEYELVGEAYVHGVMYGELWRDGVQAEWLPTTVV